MLQSAQSNPLELDYVTQRSRCDWWTIRRNGPEYGHHPTQHERVLSCAGGHGPEQFNAYIAGLPVAAFLVVMLAHLGQSFVGAWIAARWGESRPMLLAMIVGALSLAGGIAAMMMISGPDWLMIELPLYLVVAWLAGNMEQKRRASAAPPVHE